MKVTLDCIPCTVASFLRLLKSGILPLDEQERAMRRLLEFLSTADYEVSPPVLGREMHRMIREVLNAPDPYKEIKARYNKMMLDMYPKFEEMVKESDDPFDTAMRLAIAGNVIDFGPQHQMDVMETIERVLLANFAIDESPRLRKELEGANRLLYVGDNCGEIVLDKLFLEQINVSEIYFAVRNGPVLNDATIEDASMVGIDRIAKVITTGDDAPGAVWETASEEFRDVLVHSDVVISKGQGNLEGLVDVSGNVFFLLVVKCKLMGERVGADVGEFVVRRSPF
ncbi:MAG: hypothetical protein B6D63_01130 [Candidatus Latescibacteria bacterium 4484_7]|nr:MAG: hypothetical protein B6D63_01130 [Candidatus Latescibacteria bacterium 4484_7]